MTERRFALKKMILIVKHCQFVNRNQTGSERILFQGFDTIFSENAQKQNSAATFTKRQHFEGIYYPNF